MSFQAYFWSDMVLHNPHYEALFSRALGRDDMGLIKAWEGLGPLLFVPALEVRPALWGVGFKGSGFRFPVSGFWVDRVEVDG